METSKKDILTERRSRTFWVLVILGFFAIDLSIAAIAITMAAGDPSFRSIPGYGERSVAWDERQAFKGAWASKHWHTEIERISPDKIQIVVHSEDNRPVEGLAGNAKLFHYTRVAKQISGPLHEISPGCYQVAIDVAKSGLWNIELDLSGPDGKPLWFEQELEFEKPGKTERVVE